MDEYTNTVACNICGNQEFGGGPGGRLAVNGLAPRCTKCQSLERHRLFREVMLVLKEPDFASFTTLQFSADRSIDADWFAQFERSIYEGENSLDLQKIDRPTGHYDMVISNHVMEHVAYDNAAMNELGRIIKDDGYVFLTVPSPFTNEKTSDWGYAREDQHGHYRVYGRDITDRFMRYIPHLWVLSITAADPVTGTEDLIFFLCRSEAGTNRIFRKYPNATVLQMPA